MGAQIRSHIIPAQQQKGHAHYRQAVLDPHHGPYQNAFIRKGHQNMANLI